MRKFLVFILYLLRRAMKFITRAPRRVRRAMTGDTRHWGDFPSAWAAHLADECVGWCWYCRNDTTPLPKSWFYAHPKGGKNRQARRSFLANKGER